MISATTERTTAVRPLATLRERKKLRTRDALAGAMLRLSGTNGFESVTIEQVAADADVSRRTFFRYFASKEAAMFPDYAERLEEFRGHLRAAPGDETPFDCVERAFLAVAASYMRHRAEIVAQQRIVDGSPTLMAYERALDREWELEVAQALESGRRGGRTRRNARVLAGAVMGAVRATLREWLDAGGRPSLVAMGRETFAQIALRDEGSPESESRRRR